MVKARLFLPSILAGTVAIAAQADPQRASSYSIKPSDVAVPADVPPGEYRRTIRPYRNWTLICDEDLRKKQRICNISQSIVDGAGAMAFSWSLAATADGTPMMIARVPATVGEGQPIRFAFGGAAWPMVVRTTECDERICLGMLPVDARLKALIEKGVMSEVSYVAAPGTVDRDLATIPARLRAVTIPAPLEGLWDALAGL